MLRASDRIIHNHILYIQMYRGKYMGEGCILGLLGPKKEKIYDYFEAINAARGLSEGVIEIDISQQESIWLIAEFLSVLLFLGAYHYASRPFPQVCRSR